MTGSDSTPAAAALGLVHLLCMVTLILGGGLMLARAATAPASTALIIQPDALSMLQEVRVPQGSGLAGFRLRQGGELPALTRAAQQRVAEIGSARRLIVEGRRELSGEHDGVILLEPGSELIVDDLALRGAIVSTESLSASPTDRRPATLRVRGTLRIDPADDLPGLAVHLPFGAFVTDSADARFQVDGDVIAQNIHVHPSAGRLLAHVSTDPTAVPRLQARDRPGEPAWSPTLQLDPSRIRTDAHTEAPTGWADVADMLAFDFGSLPWEPDR